MAPVRASHEEKSDIAMATHGLTPSSSSRSVTLTPAPSPSSSTHAVAPPPPETVGLLLPLKRRDEEGVLEAARLAMVRAAGCYPTVYTQGCLLSMFILFFIPSLGFISDQTSTPWKIVPPFSRFMHCFTLQVGWVEARIFSEIMEGMYLNF